MNHFPPGNRSRPQQNCWIKICLVAILVVLASVALLFYVSQGTPIEATLTILDWIEQFGPLKPLAYILIYGLSGALFLPTAVLALFAGFQFGYLLGAIYMLMGSLLAATLTFLYSRFLVRDRIENQRLCSPFFINFNRKFSQAGWKIICLIRLSPVFPFNLVNCILGLSRISTGDYLIGSLIGIFPGCLAYAYLGSSISSTDILLSLDQSAFPPEVLLWLWRIRILGLVSTVAFLAYLVWIINRTISKS